MLLVVVDRREPQEPVDPEQFSRTHTLEEETGQCGFLWRSGVKKNKKREPGLAGRCRAVVPRRGGQLKKITPARSPHTGGWISEPIWQTARVREFSLLK